MIPRDILGMKRREKFMRRVERKRKRGIRTIDGEVFKILQEPEIKKRPFILLWLIMLLFGRRINKARRKS